MQDHVLWAETIVHQLPIIGSFYINYVRRWVGLGIVYLMYAVKSVTTSFDYFFAQTSTEVSCLPLAFFLNALHVTAAVIASPSMQR